MLICHICEHLLILVVCFHINDMKHALVPLAQFRLITIHIILQYVRLPHMIENIILLSINNINNMCSIILHYPGQIIVVRL